MNAKKVQDTCEGLMAAIRSHVQAKDAWIIVMESIELSVSLACLQEQIEGREPELHIIPAMSMSFQFIAPDGVHSKPGAMQMPPLGWHFLPRSLYSPQKVMAFMTLCSEPHLLPSIEKIPDMDVFAFVSDMRVSKGVYGLVAAAKDERGAISVHRLNLN